MNWGVTLKKVVNEGCNDQLDLKPCLSFAKRLHDLIQGDFCRTLSEELHRDLCQKLTAAKLELDIMALDQSDESLERARDALSEGIKGIRELMEALALRGENEV